MSKSLNICHIITRMIVGGAQENTLLTAIGHIRNGNSCTLVSGPSPGPEGELLRKKSIPSRLEVIECPYLCREINPVKDVLAYLWLRNFLKKRKFDVVHTHSSKAGIIGRAAASSLCVPVVVHTIHGLAFHRYENPIKNRFYIFAERWAARKCHRIFAVAQAMIEQSLAAKIANREKFKLVYSGMELERFTENKEREKIREKLGISGNAPVIGTVARLFPLKGYEDFLPAAAKIAKEIPELEFIIVGDGIMRGEIEKEAKSLKLKFHFTGLVPPDKVADYISAMDLLIHLSLREGLPRAVVQALVSGIPAIAYDLDGAPEVLINGKTGFTAVPRDVDAVANFAIRILKDEKLRKSLGSEGKRMVIENFDWVKMVNDIEAEYKYLFEKENNF